MDPPRPARNTCRQSRRVKQAVEFFGQWWGACSNPADGALVFEYSGTKHGHIAVDWPTRRCLYPALKTAGILRLGPTGKDRDFHSLRHTYARLVLESGAEVSWLSRQLGHHSAAFTERTYGHWSTAAKKAQVKVLDRKRTFKNV
jgi:integrase